ncbi:hypothetical protein QQ045_009233 [Rhodiola kirilowii]
MDEKANGPKLENGARPIIDGPSNPMVTPLLTDLYQFTMAYAYWKAGKHNERAVFDLYFRKNPFGGEYTIFAGLEECIRLIANYRLTDEQIDFVRSSLPGTCEDGFFDYLRGIDCSELEVYSIAEGTIVFPKVPLLIIVGPVAVVQLLETPLVNLVNFASLVTTNAARHRFVAGKSKTLLEFGLRRAQGPDGGMSASKYCYMGGFDATSNVAAGQKFGIPLRGTHSHAFVSSFTVGLLSFTKIRVQWLTSFVEIDVERYQFPVLNFEKPLYKAGGIRLDSGDLAYLSTEARKFFRTVEKEFNIPGFGAMNISASNDLNEETLDALKKQGHEVDAFGIGTYLVTCYAQAALGCVFKLVEINKQPRIKLSEDVSKVSIPCKKRCYRLYGKEGYPLVDIITGERELAPKVGERLLCRHPFNESKRAYVVPQQVEELLKCYWAGNSGNKREELPPLKEIRERCTQQLELMRRDHMRRLNPTPYKVSVSAKLYDFIHFLWLYEAPVGELQ